MSGRLGTLEALVPIQVPLRPAQDGPEDPGVLDEIDALAQRTDALCSAAVDPWEIAAGLEAEGINDALAVSTYGRTDVFALAEELYKRVPRRVAAAAPPPNPWRSQATHHLFRGILFGLPGLCYVAASRSLSAPGAVALTVVSLLLSWGASEGLSYLGYVRLGHGDRAGSAGVLRRGLLISAAVLVPATLGAGALLNAGLVGTVFAAAQALYLLTATVVLVSGGERWLLAALAPGVVGSTFYLAVGGATPLVWATGGLTVVATSGLAWWLTRGAGPAKFSRAALWGALPHVAFGLLAGALLTFTTVAALLGPAAERGPLLAGAVVTLPLSLTMGVAEWLLFRYRRRTHDLLVGTTSLDLFTWRARGAVASATCIYLIVLALTADAVAWLGYQTGAFSMTPRLFWTAVALGGGLFVALALRSCGVVGVVLGAFGLALAAETVLWQLGPHADLPVVQLGTYTVLFAALLFYALVVLGRATRHR